MLRIDRERLLIINVPHLASITLVRYAVALVRLSLRRVSFLSCFPFQLFTISYESQGSKQSHYSRAALTAGRPVLPLPFDAPHSSVR